MNTRLLQITEDDLISLESTLPDLMWRESLACNDTLTRKKWESVKAILSNIRWNYGPPSEVETINSNDL
jgi:hypothetical protein